MRVDLRARTAHFAVITVAAALLSGCASPQPSVTTFGSTPAAVSTFSEGDPVASVQVGADADTPTDPAAAAAAASFAMATLTSFCRPDAPEWLNDLYPYLSQSAGAAFGSVDPSRVQCTAVLGDAVVAAGDGVYRFVVRVTTDAGPYEVLVARPAVGAPWATEAIEQLS